MPLDVTDLSEIPADLVAQEEAILIETLNNEFPSLDLSANRVMRENFIKPAAILNALARERDNRLLRSQSLLAIEQDPALAEDEFVNAVLSNYRVARIPGSVAEGFISIIILEPLTISIPEDTIFTAGNLTYGVTRPYVAVETPDAVTTDQDRLIVQRSDGTFSFTVPVVATDVGEEFRIKRGTRVTVEPPVPNQLDALAAADFQGGAPVETNEELINRFKEGVSPKVVSGRTQISALMGANVEALGGKLLDSSIVGFGDPEMLRDRRNSLLLSGGGKADIYVQTQDVFSSLRLSKSATLIDADTKTFQISIARDDAPGYYNLDAVVPQSIEDFEGTLPIVAEVRGIDLTLDDDEDLAPDLVNLREAAFSRYQTAVIQFQDPDADVTATEFIYDVFLAQLPFVRDLQRTLANRGTRSPGADVYVIRAAVPAFATVSITVQYRKELGAPDAQAIKASVASVVNAIGFKLGRLPASVIHDAVHNTLQPNSATVMLTDLRASIAAPDTVPDSPILLFGQAPLKSLTDMDLIIPDLPDRGVSQRTTIFQMSLDAIGVTLTPVDTLAI